MDQRRFAAAIVVVLSSVGYSSVCLVGCTDLQPESSQLPVTLRHGEPGVRPFWNVHAKRFIYPPAFDVADSSGAATRYFVSARVDEKVIRTELPTPWSSLAPIWDQIPNGFLTLDFSGTTPAGETLHLSTVETIKSPGFDAAPKVTADRQAMRDAGMLGLEAVLQLPKVQHWLEPGGPDPDYPLWVHPSKLMGFLSQGMLFLSQHADDVEVADQARRVAIAAAAFLLTLREPEGSPLQGWTHSYWDGVDRGEHPIYMDQIMAQYPAEAALAFLDLYDATDDAQWLDAAVAIADTYRRTQREDGTWPLLIRRATGEPIGNKLMIPGSVIIFLDRLHRQYAIETFVETHDAAFAWLMTNPVETFAWEAQFEDTRPRAVYRNLAHLEPAFIARHLFQHYADDQALVMLARELLLFAEDQFVIWTHDDAVTRTEFFRPGMKWNGTTPDGGKDWFLPATLEQYAFYTPIGRSTANVLNAYCAAYDATGEDEYRQRARALTSGLMDAQAFHGTGEIPTHMRRTLPEESWLNNSVETARTLVEATCL